jgi:hypothetical protein
MADRPSFETACSFWRAVVSADCEPIANGVRDPIILKYYAEAGSSPLVDLDREKIAAWLARKKNKEKEIIERAGIQPE